MLYELIENIWMAAAVILFAAFCIWALTWKEKEIRRD